MCGIATIVRADGLSVDPADLARMCSAIAHRGPDGAGYAILDQGRVGLGHVRLSIVDLAGGEQPLYNEDYSIAVACNGELYDYARKLALQGLRSRDTPVRAIMSSPVLTISPDASVQQGLSTMTEKFVRHLPVVDGNGVSGMVSIGDLVKAVIEDQRFDIQQLESYISPQSVPH